MAEEDFSADLDGVLDAYDSEEDGSFEFDDDDDDDGLFVGV